MKHLMCKLKFNGLGHPGKFRGHHGYHGKYGHHGKHDHHGKHGMFHGHGKFQHGKYHGHDNGDFHDQKQWLKEEVLRILLQAGKHLDGTGGLRRCWSKGRRFGGFEYGPSDKEGRGFGGPCNREGRCCHGRQSDRSCQDKQSDREGEGFNEPNDTEERRPCAGPSDKEERGDFGNWRERKRCKVMRIEFEGNEGRCRRGRRGRLIGDCDTSDEEGRCKRRHPRFSFGKSPRAKRWGDGVKHFCGGRGPRCFGKGRLGRGRQVEEEKVDENEQTVLVRGIIVSRGERSQSV